MKVLHILTHDNLGGAARAAYRQHRALLGAGVDSKMLVRHKHSSNPTVSYYCGGNGYFDRLARTLSRASIARREKKSRSGAGTMSGELTDPRADLLREMTPEIAGADVINLHKTEHFVDLPAFLQSLPPDKPLVLSMHDLSPITGGCDYPGECTHFTSECGHCPILGSNSAHDYSREIRKLRRQAYATRVPAHFAFAANSHWTGEMARKSLLTQGFRVEVIPLCVDQTVYSPEKRDEARAALGIGLKEEVLFFGAHDISLPHKGAACLLKALEDMPKDRPMRVLTMGSGQINVGSQFRHTHFGKIESDELQALLYRAADVFVIPSLEEAFGQTALEAASCGTLVAGFRVGGITDIVNDGLNGKLVARSDSEALRLAILELLENRSMKNNWVQAARDWSDEKFSYHQNATAYASLYESLIRGDT